MMAGARPAGDVLGRGLSFPFRAASNGSLAMAEGVEDVEQAIRIILSTSPGERSVRPEFGCEIHAFIFAGLDASTLGQIDVAVRRALTRWEPRIEVEKVGFRFPEHEGMLLIDIAYRLRTTNSKRNLVYPFYVVPAEA
jgi:phage baseplate assembly protein W